jgi:hypothetical protein
MNPRSLAALAVKTLAALLSASVTLHAVYAAWAVDLRANPILTSLYCIFPGLSFLVFLFVRLPRPEAIIQAILAFGYLITASMLNWRTCAELGYCGTSASTVLETLRTKPILASFAVAILSFIAILLNQGSRRSGAETRVREQVI